MHVLRNVGASIVLGVLVAACGGGNAPTKAPDATQAGGGGGGGATQGPEATNDGGGDGGNPISFQYGKVTYTVSGPIQKTGEAGFIPQLSLFGGSQGSTLYFADSSNGGAEGSVVSVLIGADGSVVVSYLGVAGQMPASTCTTSDWNIGTTSASGKFDCEAAIVITASGATATGGKIKGEFTAHT